MTADEARPTRRDVTDVLAATRGGDPDSRERLVATVYDELRRIARGAMARAAPGHTLQATALAHEVCIRLLGHETGRWESRAHVLAASAVAMRRFLTNHARDRGAAKRGGDRQRMRITLTGSVPGREGAAPLDLLALHEALDDLAALDPRQARIVELRFFGGLEQREIACVLGVSESTVERGWRMARAWLTPRLRD